MMFLLFLGLAQAPAYQPTAPRMIYYDLRDAEPSLVLQNITINQKEKGR